MSSKKIALINKRLDAIEALLTKCEAKAKGGASASSSGSSAAGGAAGGQWQKVLDDHLDPWMATSNEIGSDVAKMAKFVQKAFGALGTLINTAAGQKKPKDQAALAELLNPVFAVVKDAKAFSKKKFRTKTPLHLRSIEEALGTLAWISISPAPVPFLKDSIPSVQFHTNKILREFRGKDDKHVTWAKQLLALLNAMHAYVKDSHTTGLKFKLR